MYTLFEHFHVNSLIQVSTITLHKKLTLYLQEVLSSEEWHHLKYKNFTQYTY